MQRHLEGGFGNQFSALQEQSSSCIRHLLASQIKPCTVAVDCILSPWTEWDSCRGLRCQVQGSCTTVAHLNL